MGRLNLAEAFAAYGAKPRNRLHSVSAITTGAMILRCSSSRFGHPGPGVLRYEDRLSREPDGGAELQSLGQHLAAARDGDLPIRMIVLNDKAPTSGRGTREIHVRADLIGKLVKFDGDHFIVDFTREAKTA